MENPISPAQHMITTKQQPKGCRVIVEDHDMSDRFFAFGDGSRRDHEDSLLSQRCGIRQPVGSNHHHSFLKRFEDRHFTECEISFETLNEVRRIWIAASRLEDSTRQWTGYFSYRGRSFQGVRVLAVEHELTSLVMHRRPRGYDARVSLRCQLSDFELGIQRVPCMHFFQEPTRGARKRKKHVADVLRKEGGHQEQ